MVVEAGLSFDQIYDEHFAFVWRNLRRLGVPDEALDDACQEVFLVVHRRLDQFEGRSTMRSWLFGIARRVSQTMRRTAKRKDPRVRSQGPVKDVALLDDKRAVRQDAQVERRDAVRILREILAEMDEAKREVFVLVELEQMSVPEVSEALGVKMNTVYSRLRVARQHFNQSVARRQAQENRRGR